jgi:hypothetical protein
VLRAQARADEQKIEQVKAEREDETPLVLRVSAVMLVSSRAAFRRSATL